MALVFLSYLIFAFGFVLLVAGADWLIKGSSSLAKKFGLSEIVIGLTIVAFGTSAPELVVNIVSSLHGSGELVVGNIIGSNIANIALVLGLAGLIAPLAIEKNLVRKDIPLGILGVGAIYFLAVKNSGAFVLGRFAGVILILGFVIFLWLIYRSVQNKKSESTTIAAIIEQEKLSLGRALFFAVSGLAALTIGGQSVVSSATEIARTLGVSEKLIGLTLVAVGTSLPELVTSVVAVWKKKVDLAIGNVIGSNVFNVFWVLGASALINPIHFAANATTDLLVLTGLSLILLTASFIGKKYTLERWQATILLTSYCGYIGFIIWRG